MIEEGYFNNNISQTIINSYLEKKPLKSIDALVLGCTHYPLIQAQIEKYYQKQKKQVPIIDSASVVAQQVKKVLDNKKTAQSFRAC
ncbi:aspartate/glutamate racemase family protein [Oscillatoria amoena NRMC-F 0135]|nr:aspartate/glutamate racemase family protein [Oscillatoria amoena NRMC-F 0135]